MKLETAIRRAEEDIEARDLASPQRRLNGLKAVVRLIRSSVPTALDDATELTRISKRDLVSRVKQSKGSILNGAENSALNILLRHISNS